MSPEGTSAKTVDYSPRIRQETINVREKKDSAFESATSP